MSRELNSSILPDSDEIFLDNLYDLNTRQRSLNKIDNANFGWFHIRTCVVAGIGFFTDAYDLFVINFVTVMLNHTDENKNYDRANIDMGLKMSAACGTLIGQLAFGWAADRFGRKKIYGWELSIMIIATLEIRGFSFDNVSKDFPRVSGINNVEKIPRNIKQAKIKMRRSTN
ncbi:31623_t:CDS:2 [Gigaspora margarita]|uniref:31623_t:CDS:1 n=1 Tax=Gigaspora margarita TaxID=4874 RepID=A0ABN7VQM6_GIGMA|nr:31623_t:CDS:2 [Gigaspora margarita]